jgi:beta-glucosidase
MNNISEIIKNMTLEEKAALCTGATSWTTIPSNVSACKVMVTDGPHGVQRANINSLISDTLPATCFPTASCTASSWDVIYFTAWERLWRECIA